MSAQVRRLTAYAAPLARNLFPRFENSYRLKGAAVGYFYGSWIAYWTYTPMTYLRSKPLLFDKLQHT
jgi:hypothetical protein